MPEAGRRVKSSEMDQPFFHTSYPHMQTPSKRTSYPHRDLSQFHFLSVFFFFPLCCDPGCQGNLSERSSPFTALCPTCQVCWSQNISTISYATMKIYCCWCIVRLHSHVRTGWFHPRLTQFLLQQARWAGNVTLRWDPRMNFSCMSLIQYQLHSISITH